MADNTDALTPEEEAQLRAPSAPAETTTEIPAAAPAAPADGQAATTEQPVQPEPPKTADGQQPAQVQPEQKQPVAPDPEADFRAYSERHKGKSPEELLKIAYNQDRARSAARANESEAVKAVLAMREGLTKRAEQVRQQQEAERLKFEETLRDDPDAAAKLAFDRVQERERREAETRDWDVYIHEQTRLAANTIPAFDKNAPEMAKFGVEALGFSETEVRQIDDARQLVGLYMAMQYSNMMSRGLVDMAGNMIAAPQPGTGAGQPTDPRLRAPAAPTTLSNTGGTSGGGVKGIRQQVADALAMADKDFSALPAGQLETMLREISGAGQ